MRKAQISFKSILLATALLGGSRAAWAFDIGYGGRLAAPDGAPLEGPLNLIFHFYRSETNPTPTLSLAKSSVPLESGIFQVNLSLSPSQLDSLMGDGSEKIYVEVEALGQRYPKQLFTYVPLALRVPVDDDSIVFSNGRLSVGAISSSQVRDLSAALATKADTTTLTTGLLGKANSSHTHAASDITDLATTLSSKANTNAALVGDVTGTLTATVVSSIRGTGVPAPISGTDSGKFLQYNGSSFVYTAITGSSGGTVTNVSATSPLSVSNGTTIPVLSISQASTFTNGYLSAGDFGTFNSKQDAITTASTVAVGTLTSSQRRGLELKPYGTGTGELRFVELAANGTNYVGFKAPDALMGDKVWTLPAADGAPGQVLKTDGQGNLSWAAGLSPSDGASANTPSSIVMRDGSGNFTAGTITASLVGAVTGNVTGNVSGTAANVTGTVAVSNGGTGLTSGTAGGIPYFASSTTLASTAALGDGQLLIGSGGTPVPANLGQGANAGVTIASAAGSLALDTAQDIRTSASPSFTGLSLGNGTLAAGTVRGTEASGENVTGPDLSIGAGNGTGTGGSGKIQFLTAPAAEAGSTPGVMTPRVTIDNDGRVGIGTTNPSALLSVYGGGNIILQDDENDPGDLIFANGSGTEYGRIYTNSSAVYLRANSARTADIAILNDSGNVGIGTTTPVNKLGVNGNANFTGNVGIGSTAPTQLLDVAGTIRSSSGGFMFPDGSVMSSALPTPSSGYSSTSDLNMAADLGGNGTGNMVMSTRGAERLRITNAGNIGIGSTAPSAKLDVVSGAADVGMRVLSGRTDHWTGYALGRTSTEATFGIAASPNALATGSVAGDVILRTETVSQRLMFGNGTSPAMTVSNGGVVVSGNLGVGTNAPEQTLEVAGIIKSASGGFMFPDGSIMTSAATTGTSGTSSTTDLNLIADSGAVGTGDAIVSTKGTERMRVTNLGNVGIGTSAPGDRLMIRSTKDSTVTPQLPGLGVLDSSLANQGVGGGIALWGNYTGTTPISGATIHAMKNTATAGDTGFNLALNTRMNGGNLTEKMRITSTGNVGIGTTTPRGRLSIGPNLSEEKITLWESATGSGRVGIGIAANDFQNFIGPTTNSFTFRRGGYNGTELLRIMGTGNVGIGTNSPSQKLDVAGVVKASGGFMFADGTVMTTAASASSSSSGGTSSATDLTLAAGTSGSGSILMNTSGAERLRVTSDGNVGIGTTVPTGALHVNRGISDTLGDGFLVFSNSNPLFAWRHPASANRLVLDRWYGGTWSEALTVDRGTGNVGIGTTSPTYRLHVHNATSSTMALGQATHGLYMGADVNLPWIGTYTNSGLRIVTNGTEKVRIAPGGFVGIGSISPTNMLSVAGGADFTGNVGIGSNIPARALDVVGVVRASAGIEFPDGSVMTTAAAAGNGTSSITDLNFAADSDANSSGEITLATRGSERMRVTNAGNIGFGTATPLSRVAVNGGLAVGSYAGANAAPTNGMIVSGNVGIGFTSPTSKLAVSGGIHVGAFDSVSYQGLHLQWNRSVGSGESWILNQKGGSSDGNDGIRFGSVTLSNVVTEWARINGSGNVGIGTSSPANRLTVNGSANFTGNVGIGSTNPSQALDVAGNIKISSVTGALIFPDGTSMTTAATTSTGSASSTDLALAADSDANGSGVITMATSGAERLRVDTGGNLGIGTTAPTAKLTLQTSSSLDGINLVSGASSSSPAYSLYDGVTERGVFGLAAAAGQRSTSAAAGDIILRATSGKLLFQTGTADATMALNNGNVGIGTTAPGALFDVGGGRLATPSLTGAYLGFAGSTLTDSSTAASGTAANMAFHAIASPTLAASNTSVTTTNAYTTYIGGAPKKGTNNTVTNAVALGIGAAAVTGQTNSYGLLVNAQTGATNNYSAIFQGGNVGIGSATPTQRLDVAGAIRSSSGGFVFPDGTVMTTAITSTTAGTSSSTDLNLAADTEATGNGAIIMSTGTTERMRLTNSGNVGIGTSVPAGLLDVNGNLTVLSSGNVGVGTTSPASRLDVGGDITLTDKIIHSGDTNTAVRFPSADTITAETSGAERMRITSTGNVGIGTTTPGNKLSVNGTANFTDNVGIGVNNPTDKLTIGGWKRLLFRTDSDIAISDGSGLRTSATGFDLNIDSYANIVFHADTDQNQGGGSTTEKMRITTTGNVGIGSTSPAYKLDVVGDINTTTCIRIAGTQQLGTCASDERFKKNITPITGSLAKLRLLSPVHYEFRTDEYPSRNFSHEVEAGLIAQELERVFPHLVVTDDDGYKRVRYGLDLNMQTIAAIKELAVENDQLKAETARLRARADRAEAEVTTLKSKTDKLEAESAAMKAFLCEQFPSTQMCRP